MARPSKQAYFKWRAVKRVYGWAVVPDRCVLLLARRGGRFL